MQWIYLCSVSNEQKFYPDNLQDRLLIKVIRPVLLGQQALPWRPITKAINLTCPLDKLLKI